MAAGDPLLVLDKVNKRFGGLKVIVDLDFVVHEEEIVGLIGPTARARPPCSSHHVHLQSGQR
jgi:ABC-type branched-subunit amino acid transport system ATPase component